MAIKKIEMRPEDGNYNDILYPKTSTDMVVGSSGETLNNTLFSFIELLSSLENEIEGHKSEGSNPHGTNKTQIGLGNVANEKQMPIAGGQFTGVAKAQENTSYTTSQLRNVIFSTSNPSGGKNGELWFKYV